MVISVGAVGRSVGSLRLRVPKLRCVPSGSVGFRYGEEYGNSWERYRGGSVDRWQGVAFGYEVIGQFQSVDEIEKYPVNSVHKGSVVNVMSYGAFVKLEPGLGKLLGILSLQSLPRRISLDFRDVFSTGASNTVLVKLAYWFSKRRYGAVPEPVAVSAHHRKLLVAGVMGLGWWVRRRIGRRDHCYCRHRQPAHLFLDCEATVQCARGHRLDRHLVVRLRRQQLREGRRLGHGVAVGPDHARVRVAEQAQRGKQPVALDADTLGQQARFIRLLVAVLMLAGPRVHRRTISATVPLG